MNNTSGIRLKTTLQVQKESESIGMNSAAAHLIHGGEAIIIIG